VNFTTFVILLGAVSFGLGWWLWGISYRAGFSKGHKRGYDTGWCDQQIDAWKRQQQRDRDRRDKHGRFIDRAAIQRAKQLNTIATGNKTT
jgi:hypothetical protein